MKLTATLALLGLIVATPASAALSGYYDSVEQISAILHNGDVADATRQLPVTGITRVANPASDGFLHWKVQTADCSISVALAPVPPKGVGKTRYEVRKVGKCK